MTKPNKDGWIRHRGGKCPVDAGTLVDVRHRDGEVVIGVPAKEWIAGKPNASEWRHNKDEGDIMAWRPHKAEQVIVSDASALTDGLREPEIPAAKYFDGPIQWRDRIREIGRYIDGQEKAHRMLMDAANEERASLVAKLKEEGFALIQSDEPNSEAESAQKDIAQQDMSDPANWRVGDLIECISFPGDGPYTEGKLYEFIEISSWGSARTIDDGGTENGIMPGQFRWHSRPPQ